jgi:hypothetical protein
MVGLTSEKIGLILLGREFPWKKMLSILINFGAQLLNWADAPMLGDTHGAGKRGKGMADLTGPQLKLVIEALEHPTFPIWFVKYAGPKAGTYVFIQC